MANKQRVGIRGRGTMSKSLAGMDPRTHRNPQVTTRGEDYETPLRVSRKTGRLGVDRDEARDLILLSPLEAATAQKVVTNIGTVAINVITLGVLDQSEGVIHLSNVSGADGARNRYNLPRASASSGYRYRIKEIASFNGFTQVYPFGSDRLETSNSVMTMAFLQTEQIVCDGTEWWLI